MYPKYPDQHDMSESSLPQLVHNAHNPREDFGEQPTDSFLADYLTTLEKQVRSGKHHAADSMPDDSERRGGRGGLPGGSSGQHAGQHPGGGGKQPMPFFRKPTHGAAYDLSGGSSTHFLQKRG